jgi:gluconolactonase
LCEHGDRRVTRIEKDGKKTVLADSYMGKKLNSPNDLVYHSNGDLYFTDPPYGLPKWEKDPTKELDFHGVYLRKKDGKLILLTKEMTRPNGIELSPDEKTLYVANSDPEQPIWKSFPVKDDGTIGEGKLFVDGTKWVKDKRLGLPDGMKIDVDGNIWATGPGGVWVFSPKGEVLGNIDTGTNTANCCFGDDGSTLYIAANHDICRVKTLTKGKGF